MVASITTEMRESPHILSLIEHEAIEASLDAHAREVYEIARLKEKADHKQSIELIKNYAEHEAEIESAIRIRGMASPGDIASVKKFTKGEIFGRLKRLVRRVAYRSKLGQPAIQPENPFEEM